MPFLHVYSYKWYVKGGQISPILGNCGIFGGEVILQPISIWKMKEETMTHNRLLFYILLALAYLCPFGVSANDTMGMVSGKVMSSDGETIDYASVFLKGTVYSCTVNGRGLYHLKAPAGDYTIVFSSVGFEKAEHEVEIPADGRVKLNVKLKPVTQLAEVIVVGSQVSKVRNSA